ncbi:hypothetical protein [uncultured Proteiniphilum sp.]|uniref:hypothetical protein n=1 Tax=uncultured Proteiniphilum sp. TaxID=497637 RepID=UPI0026375AED|nr:hypothetical protein [uncultured Proteiniphilum sp.]
MKDILLYIRFALTFAMQNATLSHIKQLRRWLKDKRSGDNTLIRELPWMTYDALDFLSSICTPDMTIFEWGSGGSTLFFARRCCRIISIEHDQKWSKLLANKLKEFSVTNVDYKEVPGERISGWAQRDYRNPDDFVSNDRNSIGLSYEKYVKAIDQYPDNYFDIVVVDGRVRNCCIKRAIPHVRKGGYLVVDNTDRKYYLAGFSELQNPGIWEKTEFQGPVFFQHAFCKTSFFRKMSLS